MKKINILFFVQLFLLTLSNKTFFKNAEIKNVKENLIGGTEYKIICGKYLSKLEIFEIEKSYSELILAKKEITSADFEKTIKKNTSIPNGKNILLFFSAYEKKKEDVLNKNNTEVFYYLNVLLEENILHINKSFLKSDLSKIFDYSLYKAQMLLCQYFLRSNNYWVKNKKFKKSYSAGIKKLISKFKILSTERLKITKNSSKKYHDVKIIFN
jgi:hypothetical protein